MAARTLGVDAASFYRVENGSVLASIFINLDCGGGAGGGDGASTGAYTGDGTDFLAWLQPNLEQVPRVTGTC